MNNAKHTPGPWHVERPYGEPGIYVGASDTSLVARVRENRADRLACNAEFNARLIAAAPDLRLACHDTELDSAHDALSALLEDEDAENDDIREAAVSLCLCLNAHHDRRQAAIAKAEGAPAP